MGASGADDANGSRPWRGRLSDQTERSRGVCAVNRTPIWSFYAFYGHNNRSPKCATACCLFHWSLGSNSSTNSSQPQCFRIIKREKVSGEVKQMDDQLQQLISLQTEQNQLLKRYLWRLRFSLLTILLMMTGVCIGLGFLVYATKSKPAQPTLTLTAPRQFTAPQGDALPRTSFKSSFPTRACRRPIPIEALSIKC